MERVKPAGLSWNAKNVMPFLAYENLPVKTPFFVICEAPREAYLKEQLPQAEFSTVYEERDTLIIRVVLPSAE